MAVPLITIQGKVLLPTGAGAEGGRVEVTLSQPGSVDDSGTAQSQRVGGRQTFAIASDGAVAFTLVPNQSIVPNGTWYDVVFRLPGGIEWRELWQLGNAPTPIDVGDIPQIQPSTPAPPYLKATEVDNLEAAQAVWRGKFVLLRGSGGAPDQLFVCLRNADGSYGWSSLASGI